MNTNGREMSGVGRGGEQVGNLRYGSLAACATGLGRLRIAVLAVLFVVGVVTGSAAERKILLLAGKVSHGPGDHEFRAGCLLLQKCLESVPGVRAEVHTNGWPADASVFDGAAAVLIYADGGGGHPAIQQDRMKFIDGLAAKGVGIGCAHYGVEVPKGDPGAAVHRWIGGHYEHQYSVNPMWTPEFKEFPEHPVTRGVKPFALLDEWYFNMRWPDDRKGVTDILVATPSDAVRKGPYVYPPGPYAHIVEASGRKETMMWVFDRPDGGRGFGFTGGHKHVNWHNDNVRKVVLNALLWIAKVEVPAAGVESTVAAANLALNLDAKKGSGDGANLTGTWKLELTTPTGTGTPTFRLVHAGVNLIGDYEGRMGKAPVTGDVRGKDVKFWYSTTLMDEARTVRYEGKIQDDGTLKGTMKVGETLSYDWTGRRE